ncbi:MAG: major capsid protein [Clostridiales bacterium]|nr:major capsid protein [Clostridiales bacterium]
MRMDIYKTKTMLAAIKQMAPVTSFLRDRYFPTGSGDLFPTEEVLVEYKDATGRKMAPVVLPRKGSIFVERTGYTTNKMVPPLVAPSRSLTIDDLNRKGFGESLYSDRTPEQRQAEILLEDLTEFDEMHTNREEYIAAQCMFNNGYTLRQYSDKYGGSEYIEYEMRFYDEAANPAVYIPGVKWNGSTSDKLYDLFLMIRMLTTKGNAATEVLLGSDAATEFLKDATIQKLLDLNNYRIGQIDPVELPQGAARLGRINVRGHIIDLLTYDGTYEDELTGAITPYLPAKQICVTAPAAGRGLYGAVSQIEQSDGQFHTYLGRRVPRYWAEKNARELTVSSRPLFIPKTKNPFITATVLD